MGTGARPGLSTVCPSGGDREARPGGSAVISALALQAGVERDLGDAGERLRDGAALLAASAAALERRRRRARATVPRTASAIFVIPVPGHERHGRRGLAAARAALPALREPVRERHREARRVRRRDQLLRARLPARRLLRPGRPADVERPERPRADLVDRPRPAQQVTVSTSPKHAAQLPCRSPPSSSSSARTLTEALARIRAENVQPSSAFRATRSSPAVVDPVGPRLARRAPRRRSDAPSPRPRRA